MERDQAIQAEGEKDEMSKRKRDWKYQSITIRDHQPIIIPTQEYSPMASISFRSVFSRDPEAFSIPVMVKRFDQQPPGWDGDGEMAKLMGTVILCRKDGDTYRGPAGTRLGLGWHWKLDEVETNLDPKYLEEMQKKAMDEARSKMVFWEDIIGLEDAKTAMQEAIEAPYVHAEVYNHFNIKPPKGVLLYGPPGCGKTMLGKAAAASMAKVHNKPYREGFFYFNGAEMIGPGFSSEVDWMKNAFKKADEFHAKNGYPAILFFDECDSMLPDRSKTNFFVKNAVNIFLSKMDGMDNAKAFVILATNNHHELDEAATRAGRIDRKIYVGRPEKAAAMAMIKAALSKKPLLTMHSADELTDVACGELYSEMKLVGDKELFHKLNGAMIVGLVEIAAGMAFRKALKSNAEKGFQSAEYGISMDDIRAAANEIHREQINLLKNRPSEVAEAFVKAATDAMKKATHGNNDLDLDNLP